MKLSRFLPFFVFLLPASIKAETQTIGGKWLGLHNADASMLIDDNEAQSLQDVDLCVNGACIRKRDGYALFRTIGVSTHPVRGGYYFRDVAGVDTIVFANDRSIYESVDSGAFSAFVTTDTSRSYYDFTDSNGYLWRANSNRDEIVKYDGTTKTYYPSAPKGNQIEVLPDRLVISGTTANPNRINFSASADFTDFATGLLETSAFTEDIGLPGQSINAIKAACNGILAWSKDSMSLVTAQTQFDLSPTVEISHTVGTVQPNTVITDLGMVYWQGQDNHFYSYDCNGMRKISEKLDVSGFAGGSAKSWQQTTEADFEAGTEVQTTDNITSGSVLLSTWTETDTTTADFSAGSTSNTSVISNRVYLSTNNTNINNNSFENGTSSDLDNWTEGSPGPSKVSSDSNCPSLSPYDGSYFLSYGAVNHSNSTVYIKDVSGNTLTSYSFSGNSDGLFGALAPPTASPCSWEEKTFDLSAYVGRWIYISLERGGGGTEISDTFLCSGGTLSYRITYFTFANGSYRAYYDYFVNGRSTIYTGTFTSAAMDTSFSTASFIGSANSTANSHSITWQTQNSSDGSSWDSAQSWTPESAPTTANKRYIRYVATLSTGGTTNGTALPYIDDVTFVARAATGTFVSQDKNIGANATSFGPFGVNDAANGGAIVYAIRTASTQGGLSAAAWTTVTDQSLITATINPWLNVRASFTGAYTSTPTLNDFTVQWNEGTITRNHGTIDKDHRLIWSVAEGTATVPNVSYIYDPRFDTWLKYSFGLDAPAKVGDVNYFGSTTSGNVYIWPSGTTDNGSAITAFWKSKDFVAPDPFVEKDFKKYSFLSKSQSGSNIDITYTINGASSGTSNNFSLTDSASLGFKRINANLPAGKFGTFINWKFGNDDADSPFEIYAFGYETTPRPWRVLP